MHILLYCIRVLIPCTGHGEPNALRVSWFSVSLICEPKLLILLNKHFISTNSSLSSTLGVEIRLMRF